MLAKMRIAHVSPVIYPVPPATYGGTERVIADLASAQAALGHEVSILGPADSQVRDVRVIGEYKSLSWHEAEFERPPPPGLVAEIEAELLRDLVTFASDFDVVHLHGSAHTSGVCAALNVHTFRTIHWRADEADHQRHFSSFAKERIIAISQRQAADVPEQNLAGVVHHGIPLSRYVLRKSDRAGLVFIGRMTDQKRPDRAIELAHRTGETLTLAGPVDPGNPAYFDSIVRPALGESIRYVGSIDDARKQQFFGSAKALVFPIDWPEPFGLVMIEAMACGTPVIAWDRGSVREVIDDGVTGIIVNSLDEAVARYDEAVAIDPAIVRRQFERRFGVDQMAAKIVDLYRR